MSLRHILKAALKRGALLAAANWQVTLIQATADSLSKMLMAAPVLGGIFLVALVVGADPGALLRLEWRELAATIVTSLMARPLVLTAFLLALAVVVVGASLFRFLVKGGVVGVLVRAEREAGPIEQAPLDLEVLARASAFSIEAFLAAARALFPRYARLGFALMAIYVLSGAVYLLLVVASRGPGSGWGAMLLLSAAFVCWITSVNLLYLLVQIVVAAEECSVASGSRRLARFLRHEWQPIAGVFAVILVLVIFATGASLLATAALGLIAFVPFFGLAVLPLQLAAWLLRGLVFQYIGLASVGAYVKLYREYALAMAGARDGADLGYGRTMERSPFA